MNDLVMLSLEAWDGVWRRNQYLIDGLLRRDQALRVLFVEPAADPLHALRRGARPRIGRGLRRARTTLPYGERLWLMEPTKWLPRRVDATSDRRWAEAVGRGIERVGMHSPRLWVNDPMGAELVDRLGVPALYDITDDWTVANREPAELQRTIAREEQLLASCQEVVVCSAALEKSKARLRRVTLIPNGVDISSYQQVRPRPTDLPPGPIALYVGTLHRDRLDVELAIATARAVSSRGRLVLAGPVALTQVDVDALTRAGVVLLGAQDRARVPGLLQHADVLVVPHVVSPFTESLDPIKLYEYAAAGRPVVSTGVAGFRDDRSGRVVAVTTEAFPGAVAAALDAGWVPSMHCSYDVDADWAHRVQQMADVLSRLGTA